MRKGRGLFAFAIAVVATRLSIAGCDDADSHIYTGAQYDPSLNCLEPLTSVDIVVGPEPTSVCAPICIVAFPADAATTAYISTMCPPYPNYPNELDAATDPPLCAAAMEAFKKDILCEDGAAVYANGEDSGLDAGAGDASDASDASLSEPDGGTPTDASSDGTVG